MRINALCFILMLLVVAGTGCNSERTTGSAAQTKTHLRERVRPSGEISYHFEKPGAWLKRAHADSSAMRNVLAINRCDSVHLRSMDSIIVPADARADIAFNFPFPMHLDAAAGIDKLVFFSYPAQAFAAYENGELVYTGPTNMGRRKDPTPTGLFFSNWKAEKTISTVDDEWELKWNFNIENKEGVGWHQYAMPGYPASHSCMRLTEADARDLYSWADQWVLDHDTVKYQGTPVIIFGTYDFDKPKPWLQLISSAHALDIRENELAGILSVYKSKIIGAMEKRKQAGSGS